MPALTMNVEYPLPVNLPGFAPKRFEGRRRKVAIRVTYSASSLVPCTLTPLEYWILDGQNREREHGLAVGRFERRLMQSELEWLYLHDAWLRGNIHRSIREQPSVPSGAL
jgi:hypothetical protein